MKPLPTPAGLEAWRIQALAEATRAFAEATVDYSQLLKRVARTTADILQGSCQVRLVSDDGLSLETVASASVDAGLEAQMNREDWPRTVALPHVLLPVLQGAGGAPPCATPVCVGQGCSVNLLGWENAGVPAGHTVCAPMIVAGGRVVGALSVTRHGEDAKPLSAAEVSLHCMFADHAALAITNAQMVADMQSQLSQRQHTEEVLRATEGQLRHAQKMEAVGRLAGGIAHDFNNLLSVILCNTTVLSSEMSGSDPMRAEVEEIHKAGERAARLTRQLLAFSRQQVLEPKVVDLNQVLGDVQRMLARVLGEDIRLTLTCHPEPAMVKVDLSQMEQVILNLAVNARDAMPDGGTLTVSTERITLEQGHPAVNHGASPGPHVMLAIRDSGVGMDEETRARIFEPFFTTKGRDKGTGLGLATVFGIVHQSEGAIWVDSAPDAGSAFHICLPVVSASAAMAGAPPVVPVTRNGTECVLLTEDEDPVRRVAHKILTRHGYTVLEARNAGEALLLSERHPGQIDLLLTDVVMPHMNGKDLAHRLMLARPSMKVLYMSGFTEHSVVDDRVRGEGLAYLQKPFTPVSLTLKIREVLDAPVGAAAGPMA